MNKPLRSILTLLGAGVISLLLASPAMAGNSVSRGHGVKCTWVLVSSVGGNNVYQQVCRRGV
ncbi:MAG: hypothetical protein JNM32_00140 [Dechloromonas sp.]|jgi:hypothetical protein|nr:hypothetical protein [Dechloromonas sp.]